MLRLRKKLKNDDSWNREALGIYDEIVKQFSPINGACGPRRGRRAPDGTKPNALAVDMSHDRRSRSAPAGSRATRRTSRKSGPAPTSRRGRVDRGPRWSPNAGVIDGVLAGGVDGPTLKARGVKVHVGTAGDMAKACGQLART
jgi:hypothetical protein